MGYIRQKLLDILGKRFAIYYGIYWLKIVSYIWPNYVIYGSIGYIKRKLRDILSKIIGNIWQKLWDILWDIFVKGYGIYLTTTNIYPIMFPNIFHNCTKYFSQFLLIISNYLKILSIISNYISNSLTQYTH